MTEERKSQEPGNKQEQSPNGSTEASRSPLPQKGGPEPRMKSGETFKEWSDKLGQALVANLNRNALKEQAAEEAARDKSKDH